MTYDALHPDHNSLPQRTTVFFPHILRLTIIKIGCHYNYFRPLYKDCVEARSLMARKAPMTFVMSIVPSVCLSICPVFSSAASNGQIP
jgi:hypothetical protein